MSKYSGTVEFDLYLRYVNKNAIGNRVTILTGSKCATANNIETEGISKNGGIFIFCPSLYRKPLKNSSSVIGAIT